MIRIVRHTGEIKVDDYNLLQIQQHSPEYRSALFLSSDPCSYLRFKYLAAVSA